MHLTGRFRLETATGVVEGSRLPGRQGRLALAVLLAEPDPVERSRLADVIWDEQPPPGSWRRDLSAVISKLRACLIAGGLPPGTLAGPPGCYHFVRPPGTWVDIEAAREEVRAGEAALSAGRPDEARAAAGVAVDVARRPLLPGEEGLWLDERRAELADLAVRGSEVSSDAAAAAGDFAEAARSAGVIVAMEPLRESGYLRLMRAHMAAGDAAEALRVYERCRVLLAEEIGAIPSADLEAAYRDALGVERDSQRAVGPAGRRSLPIGALPAPLAMAAQGFFCSREVELGELMTCWRRALEGACRLVLIEGEPGVGKTRLTAEMARGVHGEGAVVLYGACDEAEVISFQPLLEGLRTWMTSSTVQALERVDPDVLSELSRLLPELSHRMPELPPPRPAEPDTERFRLFEAVRRWLSGLAAGRPVLVVLDDLQWADGASVALLRHLVRDLGSAGVLLVAVARRGDVRHDLLTLATDGRLPAGWVVHSCLGDLSEEAVASLIAGLLDREDPASLQALADAIYQATGGNAFFVTQLARHLAETLSLLEPAKASLGTFVELEVPDSVKVAIELRVARLSRAAREFLQLAAITGREFDVGILGAGQGRRGGGGSRGDR